MTEKTKEELKADAIKAERESISVTIGKKDEEEIEKEILSSEEVKKFLQDKQPKKVIVVPGRIVNVVV